MDDPVVKAPIRWDLGRSDVHNLNPVSSDFQMDDNLQETNINFWGD